MYMFSEDNTRKNEKFIKFSRLRNGFLNELLDEHHRYDDKNDKNFKIYRTFELIFMSLILIRVLKSIPISDDNYTLLMYIGRPWHYMGVNYLHIELPFFLWTSLFIGVYVFVIHSPDKHYEWLEIFAFLKGILPHQQIGKL